MNRGAPDSLHLRRTKSWGRMVNPRIPATEQLNRLSTGDHFRKNGPQYSEDSKHATGMLTDLVYVPDSRLTESPNSRLKIFRNLPIEEESHDKARYVHPLYCNALRNKASRNFSREQEISVSLANSA